MIAETPACFLPDGVGVGPPVNDAVHLEDPVVRPDAASKTATHLHVVAGTAVAWTC